VTWVTTGIGIGMALGAFLSGWVVDAFGARSGFLVSGGAATAALSIAVIGQRVLARGIAPAEA
jgi:predicted MFS family arabinose efflux permease